MSSLRGVGISAARSSLNAGADDLYEVFKSNTYDAGKRAQNILTKPDGFMLARRMVQRCGSDLRSVLGLVLPRHMTRPILRQLEDTEALHLRRIRGDATPLYNFAADPTGVLRGYASDGRVAQNTQKVLDLRSQTAVSRDDVPVRNEATMSGAEVLIDGEVFAALHDSIRKAKRTICLSVFSMCEGQYQNFLLQLLLKKLAEGVDVHIITDAAGSGMYFRESEAFQKLREAGAQIVRNIPIPVMRINGVSHRKMIVIDNEVAYIGGTNLTDSYNFVRGKTPHFDAPTDVDTHDVMVRVWDDAAKQAQLAFFREWLYRGGKMHPEWTREKAEAFYFAPSSKASPTPKVLIKIAEATPYVDNEIKPTYLTLIRQAEKTLYLEGPYLTSREIQAELAAALARGVKVRLVVPFNTDHKWVEAAMLLAIKQLFTGVNAENNLEVFSYSGDPNLANKPGLLSMHGKVLVVDNKFVCIGTANASPEAFDGSFEIMATIASEKFARDVQRKVIDPHTRVGGLGPKTRSGAARITPLSLEHMSYYDRFRAIVYKVVFGGEGLSF